MAFSAGRLSILCSPYPAGDSFQCITKALSPSPAFTGSCALLFIFMSLDLVEKPLLFKNRRSRSRERVSDVALAVYGKRSVSFSLVEECRTPITCELQ